MKNKNSKVLKSVITFISVANQFGGIAVYHKLMDVVTNTASNIL